MAITCDSGGGTWLCVACVRSGGLEDIAPERIVEEDSVLESGLSMVDPHLGI